jgi:hypothetical protein
MQPIIKQVWTPEDLARQGIRGIDGFRGGGGMDSPAGSADSAPTAVAVICQQAKVIGAGVRKRPASDGGTGGG